jgi:hypothetical protein
MSSASIATCALAIALKAHVPKTRVAAESRSHIIRSRFTGSGVTHFNVLPSIALPPNSCWLSKSG